MNGSNSKIKPRNSWSGSVSKMMGRAAIEVWMQTRVEQAEAVVDIAKTSG